MKKDSTLILTEEQVDRKLSRIAVQIYENNLDESSIYFLGISEKGMRIARHLKKELKSFPLDIKLIELIIDKENPIGNINGDKDLKSLKNQSVVLIDDVLNTGKVLMCSAAYLMSFEPKHLSTVCLVDRRHRLYPIKADYVGLTLATTMKDHIHVDMEKGGRVYLV